MLLLLVLCCKEAPTSAPIQSVHGIIYSSSGRIQFSGHASDRMWSSTSSSCLAAFLLFCWWLPFKWDAEYKVTTRWDVESIKRGCGPSAACVSLLFMQTDAVMG